MSDNLSPLMQRQVDRAREVGLQVDVTPDPSGSTRIVVREGGPWPGWIMVTVVPSAGGRWAHYARKTLSPGTKPKEVPVGQIARVIGQYVEDQKYRQSK